MLVGIRDDKTERVCGQMKHITALPLQRAPHGQHAPRRISAHQHRLLPQPAFERVERDDEAFAAVASELLGDRERGVGVEIQVIRLDPSDALAARAPLVAFVYPRPNRCLPPAPRSSGCWLLTIRARDVSASSRDGGAEEL